jgi:hypothetical protein
VAPLPAVLKGLPAAMAAEGLLLLLLLLLTWMHGVLLLCSMAV